MDVELVVIDQRHLLCKQVMLFEKFSGTQGENLTDYNKESTESGVYRVQGWETSGRVQGEARLSELHLTTLFIRGPESQKWRQLKAAV